MINLGDFAVDSTIYVPFSTNDGSGGRVEPDSAFEAADVRIYKNGSDTQRTGVSGLTMVSPFDSMVGIQWLTVDLSDNDDAGFYAAGNDYAVVLYPDETIDSQNISSVPAVFSIENRFDEVDVTKIGGGAQSATDLKDFADAGYDPSVNKVEGVKLTDTCTTNTDMVTVTSILTTQMTEAYAADGTAPTLAQCLFMLLQSLHEFSISSVTRTVKKLDGSTTAMTFTLDDATNPTSTTRAT